MSQDAREEAMTSDDPRTLAIDRQTIRWLVAAAAALLCLLTLYIGRDLLVPIALSVLIWFLINAIADRLSTFRPPVWLAKTAAVAIVFGLMSLAGWTVAVNTAELSEGLTLERSGVLARLHALASDLGLPDPFETNWLEDGRLVSDYVSPLLAAIRDVLSGTSLVFLYVLFLLLDQRFFPAKLSALIADPARRETVSDAFRKIATEARLYLWLMCLISLGVGLATYFFCKIFGVNGAGFWGFLAFILNFIPTLGSITAVVLPCLYALITFDDPLALLSLVACLAATQFVAGEIVLPRVMGDHLNLSSFVILFVLVLWGALWGPVGMFLAIPITVIIMSVCAKFQSARFVAVILSKDGRISSG